jgi:CelD/BcsL family acetyltransferase involved in cellulose biosynthesis
MPSDPTNPKRQALQVSTITSDAGFTGLHHAWNDLERNHVPSNIFLSHEWFAATWAWRRQDSTLCLQVARRGGHTVGILPLIRTRNPHERCRRLELLTVVDTQVADLIAGPADLAEITQAFAESLTLRRDWDILQLDYLLPEGAILQRLGPITGTARIARQVKTDVGTRLSHRMAPGRNTTLLRR